MKEEPIQEEYRAMLQAVAQALDEFFNPDLDNKRVAFALLIAPFEGAQGGRVNYVANADRKDVMKILEELLARWKGMSGHQGRLSIDQMMSILNATRGRRPVP
jgi:hypothetical protein